MQAPGSTKGTTGPTTYAENKERGYNSKAKSLIYGGDDRGSVTPKHEGKRPAVSAKAGMVAPFATYAEEPSNSPVKEHHAKAKTKDGASKPTGAVFDADVYRQQIADNMTNMQASKARNYTGNGVFN